MAIRKTRKPLPDQSTLNRLLSYDRETGILTWRDRDAEFAKQRNVSLKYIASWNASHAGKRAHTELPRGYVGVSILGIHYMAHRVIWKMVYGVEPDHIDHINGDKGDNRLLNLRDVDASENQRNRKMNSNNSTGYVGVQWCRTHKKYVARIGVSGKTRTLGRFSQLADAISVRKAAEKELNFFPLTKSLT